MATVADLERLQALLKQLVPLSAMRRGTVIRANDWNVLVGAVTEVARTVLADTPGDVAPPHEHTDQVQLSWLDARLRALLTTGGLSDPSATARMDQIERSLDTRRGDIDGLDGRLAALRGQLTELGTRDLIRQADVTKVRRNVEALGDAREDVASLRESLNSVRGDLDRVIEIGRLLQRDGEPIDVPGMVDRLTALETFRAQLTRPDGTELDAAELERRLTELVTTLVTEEELDEALRTYRPNLPPEESDRIKEEVLGTVDTRLATGFDGVRAEVATTLDARLADVDARVARAVTAQLPALRDELLAATGGQIDAAVAASAGALRALLESRLSEQAGELDRDLGARIDAVAAQIVPVAGAEAERRLDARLPEIAGQLAGLAETTSTLQTRAAGVDRALAAHAEALAGVRAAVDTVDARIDHAARTTRDAAEQTARGLVDGASTTLREELTQLAARLIEEQLGAAVNRLRGEIREIARDEVARAMLEIDRMIAGRLDERFDKLPDTLADIFRDDFHRRGPLHQLISQVRG